MSTHAKLYAVGVMWFASQLYAQAVSRFEKTAPEGGILPKSNRATVASTRSDPGPAWVRHYGGGFVPAEDEARVLALDPLGRVLVAGFSGRSVGGDLYFLRYDPQSGQLVSKRTVYSASSIESYAVDADGNVYLTGMRVGVAGFYSDYMTVKYDPAGEVLWEARYDGPAKFTDIPRALAVDKSGNVYVTGESKGPGTNSDLANYDFATVKYDALGVPQWVARYNGPSDSDDRAAALAIDDAGNVFVTGASWNAGTRYDYLTIKYNAAGEQQWVARYDGGSPDENFRDDGATAIALDHSGNVYVTGASTASPASSQDYLTIKYSATGVQQWVARYQGPAGAETATAIAVDKSMNVYVTGGSESPSPVGIDFATVKYNAAGVQQWVTRFNGPQDADDAAYLLRLSASGNVCVAGGSSRFSESYTVVQYSSSGVMQWAAQFFGADSSYTRLRGLALDEAGNVYVTGGSKGKTTGSDFATLKYSATGVRQWLARFDGPGSTSNRAAAIAVDHDGGVIVAGTSKDSLSSDDYATIKYDAAGALQWSARYNGAANSDDHVAALAADEQGNVYVTGSSRDLHSSSTEYTTIKYNTAGAKLWETHYEGEARALALDGAGNVYVTGQSGNDIATLKYDPSGARLWVVWSNTPQFEVSSAIAIDRAGSVYVAGEVDNDYLILRHQANNGFQRWSVRYNGPANGEDRATAVAVDAAGYLYVTGASYGLGSSYDFATIKYHPAQGAVQWARRYDGPAHEEDYATALALDHAGNVYVTGWSVGAGTARDFVTIKYGPSGFELWRARYDGPANGDDRAYALALDAYGNLYVTGESRNSTNSDFAVIKYDSSGVEQWVIRYDGPGNGSEDVATVSALAKDGNLFLAGTSTVANNDYNGDVFTTLKYATAPVSVAETETRLPHRPELVQNYPNPFNPSTTIRYSLPHAVQIELKVYNVAGEEIATLAAGRMPAGDHEVQWRPLDLPSGVYLYRLHAGRFTTSRKLLLMR